VPRMVKLPWIPAEAEWLRILEVFRGEPARNRVMLALAYDAALRREELCSLRTESDGGDCARSVAHMTSGRIQRANDRRREGSPDHNQPRLSQVDATSDDTERRPATVRTHLTSEGSLVRTSCAHQALWPRGDLGTQR